MQSERVVFIDYLKAIGLLLVILAHVNAPEWIMQLRSFDVPLLVFISGYLARKTYRGSSVIKYYRKRIIRLAVPAWVFLAIFYGIIAVVYSKPSVIEIIKGVCFQRDAYMVGMMWVIWVYLVCSFLIPVIDKIGFSNITTVGLVFLYLIYEAICRIPGISESRLIYCSFFTIIPWGTVTYLGYYYSDLSKRKKLVVKLISLLFFGLIAFALYKKEGAFIYTNSYKYPAQIYYLSFAILIVFLLFSMSGNLYMKNNKLVAFVSSSSLWIYFWHILFLYIVKNIIRNDAFWIIQYILIIILSCSLTYIQNKVVRSLMKKYKISFLKVFLG